MARGLSAPSASTDVRLKLQITLIFLTSLLAILSLAGSSSVKPSVKDPLNSSKPEFAEPIPNVTIAVGREAVLKCTVENLGLFKVAWIKMDTQTLLTIHTHVITRDDRIRITHNNFRQWYLHIKDVKKEDRGFYMCQINTEPMTSHAGYLDVLVPPSIVESETSSDTVMDERSKVSLRCRAAGYPPPTVTWRREDGKDVNMGTYGGKKYSAPTVEGEYLNITQVTREGMGAYLCIASNGVPPSVSKRILLQVNFRPMIRVPNQLVGAPAGTDVNLECLLEASPRPLTSWIRNDGVILLNNQKYVVTEEQTSYRIRMKLRIANLDDKDFGSYKCVAKNTLGEKEGLIRLYEIPPPTTLPRSTTLVDHYYPRVRNSHDSRNDSFSPRKSYGVPSTNSLMDESHDFRSHEKEARPSRVQNRMEQENGARSFLPKSSENSQSGSNPVDVWSKGGFFATVFLEMIIYWSFLVPGP